MVDHHPVSFASNKMVRMVAPNVYSEPGVAFFDSQDPLIQGHTNFVFVE